MKRKWNLFITIIIASVSIVACGKSNENPDNVTIEPQETTDSQETIDSQDTAESQDTTEQANHREEMIAKYISVLNGIYQNHTFPDGSDCGYDSITDLSDNQFAVYDIDGDGKDELIITYVSSSMAGMVHTIYGYETETDSVVKEFSEFPAVTYYEDGKVLAQWSHNQGLAGFNFWPYNLYQYNKVTDQYELIAMVDAWDKSLSATDYDDNAFPDELDSNGSGMVYYVMEDGEYSTDTPISQEDYNSWYESVIGDASPINVSYLSMTQENIDSIQ